MEIIASIISENSDKVSLIEQEVQTIVSQSEATVITTTNEQTVVALSDDNVEVIVSEGSQGPQGPQGDSTNYIQLIAATNLSGHRVVTSDSNGQVIYADNTNPAHADKIVGITTAAYTTGTLANIQIVGQITEPSWTWDINQPIFVSTNGLLTQTPPSSGFIYQIGFALTPTKMVVQMQMPITLA